MLRCERRRSCICKGGRGRRQDGDGRWGGLGRRPSRSPGPSAWAAGPFALDRDGKRLSKHRSQGAKPHCAARFPRIRRSYCGNPEAEANADGSQEQGMISWQTGNPSMPRAKATNNYPGLGPWEPPPTNYLDCKVATQEPPLPCPRAHKPSILLRKTRSFSCPELP